MSKQYHTSFGDIMLTVTPQQMYAAASTIESKVKQSQKALDKLVSTVKGTSSYWDGDVSKAERERFDRQNENFQKLISNLNNYVSELRLITQIYEIGESSVSEAANALPTDILS